MSTNKHATIRYHALDRCFSNYGRKFFIEDLINSCNEALYEYSGITDGVKRRQVYDDMTFMESEQGWSIPLERLRDGKRVFYRYSDKSYSIKKQIINQSEAAQLKETLSILSRFRGLPQFEWIEEMQIRLEDTFHLKGNTAIAVGFEQNPYLKGLNNFSDLFSAINNRLALRINYQGFKEQDKKELLFHPWFLKQYNNRWFLFGFNDTFQAISNLAIDRIISIQQSSIQYRINENIYFSEFFDDVVGVSVKPNVQPEKIILKISSELWPYIESKPIHGSQKKKANLGDEIVIELDLQINYELIAVLFSFMDGIEVIEPEKLRNTIKIKAEKILNKNS